jgi:N-acetylglucosamine-6-phosphate deacetylase
LAYRAGGPKGLALVTDAMASAGIPNGEYTFSGRRVRLENGSVCLSDGTLAGSTLTMDQAVPNVVRFLGITLEDTMRMISETPARVLGLSAKGRIVLGADAVHANLSTEVVVEETTLAGETMCRRGDEGHGR